MTTQRTQPLSLVGLPAEIQQRLPIAMERARQKTVQAQHTPATHALLAAAQNARKRPQRVLWLQRWASAWVAPLAAQAACRRGCCHCCHIPVPITSAEARLVAERVGQAAASPEGLACGDWDPAKAAMWQAGQRRYAGQPCPFLRAGECAIYDSRPFSCRVHISLDDDDLLCRLLPGQDVPVPYADTRQVQAIFISAQPGETLADIREFFPALRDAIESPPAAPIG